jgi:hypothetical protein
MANYTIDENGSQFLGWGFMCLEASDLGWGLPDP